MSPSSRPSLRFQDILENIARIRAHLLDCDDEEFAADDLRRDAVERCLQRIAEAAAKLGPLAEELVPNVPWQKIRSMGNVLRHNYDETDPELIWETVLDLGALAHGTAVALEHADRNES